MATFAEGAHPLVARLALSKLSSDLVYSETLRQRFIDDPAGFISSRYGIDPSEEDIEGLRDMRELMDGGLCCKGCGCLAGPGSRTVNPSANP